MLKCQQLNYNLWGRSVNILGYAYLFLFTLSFHFHCIQLFHRGPKNTDVFSESYNWPTSEDLPEHIREGQQKIKDLLLQVGYLGFCISLVISPY